jgi:hypothetical protein
VLGNLQLEYPTPGARKIHARGSRREGMHLILGFNFTGEGRNIEPCRTIMIVTTLLSRFLLHLHPTYQLRFYKPDVFLQLNMWDLLGLSQRVDLGLTDLKQLRHLRSGQ